MREELDFKSLRFFSALYRLGNVSPAADALDISQPTGSLLLKKLRDHFADPLFVRVGQRMIPTPRADAIAPTISTLLQLADNDLAVKPEFLPQQSQRNFTIGMTDISQMTLLPLLQIALQQQAADGITFTVQNLDEQTLNALESGKCRSRDRLSDAASGKRLPATSLRSIICLPGCGKPSSHSAHSSAPKTGARKSIWRSAWRGLPMAIWISCLMSTTCPGALR
ncbi:LysR-family transcriptional regulator [Klebsiella aerogenes]|nr:LysR-family transcriptional regulator [Klebsiella aerogenes]